MAFDVKSVLGCNLSRSWFQEESWEATLNGNVGVYRMTSRCEREPISASVSASVGFTPQDQNPACYSTI